MYKHNDLNSVLPSEGSSGYTLAL